VLCDPVLLADWAKGAVRLHYLTNWLRHRNKHGEAKTALQWRLLEEGFGRAVAEAYRDGMKALWRVTAPERPKHTKNNRVTVKYTTILSFAGLGIEAAEQPYWASHLSSAEAERAALHACLSEQGYPDWIEALIDRHPTATLPIVRRTLQQEWSGRYGSRTDLLSHYGWSERPVSPSVQRLLFEAVTGKAPKNLEMLDCALRILRRLDLNDAQRRRTATLALRRLRAAKVANEDGGVRCYLAMLFVVDADRATGELADWLDGAGPRLRDARAETLLGALFGRHQSLAVGTLHGASVSSLEAVVRLAYRYVRPEEDRRREGTYTPDARDDAEAARNTLLGALLDRPGAEAYRAMRALAVDQAFRSRAIRFRELAHGKAEQDTEPPAWTPAEVLALERCHVAPVKSGEKLLRVVMGVLADIQSGLFHADATSQPLVARAQNEDEVQKWIAEQMSLRANGRFHVYREAQVAGGNKPDIIVSSTAAPFEVAVEVKHGGMAWTVRDLERALARQLAGNYLKPQTRRHGVLVVSHHEARTWRDPDTRVVLDFCDLLERLRKFAGALERNRLGPIEVRVFGIDASPAGVASTARSHRGSTARNRTSPATRLVGPA
jgi:hypothetical protein